MASLMYGETFIRFSISDGERFFPPAVMIMSFLRSVIHKCPCLSMCPISPVCNHPSIIVSLVASRFLKYPLNVPSERVSISPSSATRTSEKGNGFPTEPKHKSSAGTMVATAVFSVIPYPSRTGTPTDIKNSSTWGAIGAAPDRASRTRIIPILFFNDLKTNNQPIPNHIESIKVSLFFKRLCNIKPPCFIQ